MSAMGSLLLAAGFALCGVAVAAAAERRSELVHYNDVQIDVVIDGSGPAVVLLPSLARDSDDYDEVAEGLAAAGFRVLRPKPRGIGRSTGPMTKISLHDFARDIAEVVKKLGGGKAVVVGHAYGNWVARMTAADHPDLVRGVVIAAAAAKQYAPELSTAVTNAGNLSLSDERAPRGAALWILRAGQRSDRLAEGMAPGNPRQPACRGRGGQAGRMVVGRHGAAPRPAGRERSFQAGSQAQRDEGRIRIARHRDGHSEREPRADPRAAQGRRRGAQPVDQEPALEQRTSR